jgi:hypothetical protein
MGGLDQKRLPTMDLPFRGSNSKCVSLKTFIGNKIEWSRNTGYRWADKPYRANNTLLALPFEERPGRIRAAASEKTKQNVIWPSKIGTRPGDVIKDARLGNPSRCGHCIPTQSYKLAPRRSDSRLLTIHAVPELNNHQISVQ